MKKLTTWCLLLSIYITFIAPAAVAVNAQGIQKAKEQKMTNLPDGLKFRLSEGVEGAEKREKQPLAATDPLSQGDASSLLKRLPDIKPDKDDQTEFAKRAGSLPAPKTGQKIPVKFPSDEMRGTPKIDTSGQTLQVIRHSPDGEIGLAPDLSVTFSQPMVAVTSQEEAAKYAPVELTPNVEGRWRWLGTKTLMFDTEKRFPMATKFTARVPAGTKSANGQTLQKDVVWTFTTPPPKVEQMWPQNQIVRRDALMFVSFDQEIDPDSVLKTISVTGQGRKLSTRLATQAEIDGDASSILYYSKQVQPHRWLAFRATNSDGLPENALPAASTITVTVEKETHSAEGPLTTTKAQSFTFQTYSSLKFNGGYCNYRESKTCSPFDIWYLEFNNSIDTAKFTKEMIHIEPAVDGLSIYPSGNNVYIQGYKKGRTTYKITVDGSISDMFGQSLGQPATAAIRVGSAPTNLYSQGGFMTLLDPTAKTTYSIYSTNLNDVKVRMYSVEPKDWRAFQDYVRHINYDDTAKRPPIPGRLVADKLVPIAVKPDEMVETRIDISPALDSGFGNVILDIEPTVRQDKYDRTRVFTWLQSTQIGLDAFVDNSELVGFATELRTGKPLAGVELAIHPNVNAVSQQITEEAEEGGFLASVWNWLTSPHHGGPRDQTQAIDSDGFAVSTETIVAAQTNRTGENGILRLALPDHDPNNAPSMLIAKRGKDTAFLPENTEYYWQDNSDWYKKRNIDQYRWFVFDDRKMYKPKEQVSVKGYIRKITAGEFGDVEGLGDVQTALTYSVKDARDNEIAKGSGTLNPFGAFDLKFSIPDNANLGNARIDINTSVSDYQHQFQIQEFRRPEFEVTSKVESEAPHFVGGTALLSVEAKYYAGGGLANAETNWTVNANPTNYTPPNRGDYTFGTWTPWWRFADFGGEYAYGGRGYYGGGTTQTFKGVTDASGKHLLKIDFESVKPPRPYTITAASSVQDVNRQTWSSTTSLLVHPSELYIGIKTPRTFVQKGEKIDIESIVTDIDGKLIANRDAEIKAVLKDWQFDKGSWQEVTVDEQTCSIKSVGQSSSEPGAIATGSHCSFIAKSGGQYTITATVMDDKERFNESVMTVWVPGGKQPPKRNVEQEEAQIIPSKKDYAPGDVAELLVIAPFTPAEGVLTLRRDGLIKTERFTMKDSSITLKIPLEEKYLPNINVQVDLVGAEPRTNDKGEIDTKLAPRPAFASGNINLPISTASRKLTVAADPVDKTLAPGGTTKVKVTVTDNHGEPVANSEVAVVVVDESVLALSRYTIGDPMDTFYTPRGSGVTDYHSRKDLLLANPGDIKKLTQAKDGFEAEYGGAVGGLKKEMRLGASVSAREIQELPINGRQLQNMAVDATSRADSATRPEAQQNTIMLRENFNALALWSPTVKTDSNGRATLDVKLPDNLTRYRITAVSVDTGKRFGKAESTITAKQPLMVRPSAPRFMNFGDRVDLPVVVQNQSDKDMTVDVAIRATNAVLSPGFSRPSSATEPPEGRTQNGGTQSAGKHVVVKANDRAEVRFPVSTLKAGTARFQIAVSSGKFSDAAEISLPVWTPATTEAFATYGTTDQNGAIIQPVTTPGDVFSQFGGLEVTTSSTQLQELTDAFLYLTNYPYACSEQISSRMISIAAMRDVLGAFKAKDMPTPEELNKYFARDIEILQSRQRDDGSFGLWKRDKERYEYPFLTIHVAHALALAKAKGYKVPDEMLAKTRPYLKNVESHFDDWYKNAPEVRWTISAYALYIRDLMGDKDAAKAKRLLAEMRSKNPSGSDLQDNGLSNAPFEALGWILSVLANDANSQTEVQAILHFLNNRTTETAAAANFVTDYRDGGWLIMASDRRADGVLLEAMIKADAKNDLIPKLVRGLLDHRVKGAWSNTQENVFILLALDKYFNAFEKVTPAFVSPGVNKSIRSLINLTESCSSARASRK